MRSRRFQRKPPSGLAADFAAGDGSDPRLEQWEGERSGAANRKALQLAAQVERTLVQVLAGECGDEVLSDLRVESVQPAPDSGHLLVVLSPVDSTLALETILTHLARAGGRLRSEVAKAIYRKKTPELHFQITRRDA